MVTATVLRRASLIPLLAGPAALAFFSGGYFDEPRLWAALAAWALVAGSALAGARPLPAGLAGRAAVAGLAALTAWTALSVEWAPLAGPAGDDAARALLYTGALIAAAALLRDRVALRSLEPALATGCLAVIGYGLAGRLLPGIVELGRSATSAGRLEQPLTYWNATGALAAMGLVLCARIGGDASRGVRARALALAASAPLGAGVYLSFSRGALAAVVLGLAALCVLAPTRAQLRAAVIALAGGAAASAVASALPAVRALEGSAAAAEREGLAMLAALLAVMGAGWLAGTRLARAEGAGRLDPRPLRLPRPRHAALVAVLLVAGLGAAAAGERGPATASPVTGATAARLASADSNRYDYWRVALGGFADAPVRGVGASGFRVEWLRERRIAEPVRDAHSLYIETAAELGLVGLALLALFLGGVAAAARAALRAAPAAAAGPIATVVVWALHAGVDWDWEMPALTLVAIVLAGGLLALGEAASEAGRPAG